MFIKMLVRKSNYHVPLVGLKLVLGITARLSANQICPFRFLKRQQKHEITEVLFTDVRTFS